MSKIQPDIDVEECDGRADALLTKVGSERRSPGCGAGLYENGETCLHGTDSPRIVQIGTHREGMAGADSPSTFLLGEMKTGQAPRLRSPGPRSRDYFGGRALTPFITASRTVVMARVSSLGRTCAHFRGSRDAMSKERRWAPLARSPRP